MSFHRLLCVLLIITPLHVALAQRADSTPEQRPDSLHQRMGDRFAARVQHELGLTNDQAAKLRASSQTYGARRRELRSKEIALREALAAQLRPGVAANQDSVTKLTDALLDLRVSSAQTSRDEMKDMAKYLNPVQRARVLLIRERMLRRFEEGHSRDAMRGHRMRDHSSM
ncbi:MAG TPA: Spy/CpxP family protein refolding chaperone [Gemmatimonadales bacterium]|nr:Spy/CpxP family protein refolding chaperone [Gemmatimonadales bacterium]